MYALYSHHVADQNIGCIIQCSQGVYNSNKCYGFTYGKFYLLRDAGTNKFFKIQYLQHIENVKYSKLSRKEQSCEEKDPLSSKSNSSSYLLEFNYWLF